MKHNGRSGIHELVVNKEIASLLDKQFGWTVRAERTKRVRNKNLRPDIVVDVDGNAVVIETEHDPANDLQADLEKFLYEEISGLGKPIAAIGIKFPRELKYCDDADLNHVLKKCQNMSYCVMYPDGSRFPRTGYLQGSLINIRTTVRMSSIPTERVKEGLGVMIEAMKKISHKIKDTDAKVRESICHSLKQKPSNQTWNMAGLVLLNASTFYEELATLRPEVEPTQSLRVVGVLPQGTITKAWRRILNIDYAPIFESAVEILESLPSGVASEIVETATDAVSKIMALRIIRFGDFYGMLYQTTLLDRKAAAAFYTKPEAAVLLAGLLMPPEDDSLWNDADRIRRLKIADFACGSGTLLSAAYSHIVGCSSSDMSSEHAHMMENCFYGFDIFPVATHFAVSNMAAMFPNKKFDRCNIYTMRIGPNKNGHYLGSLDLIKGTERFTKTGRRLGGKGSKYTHAASMKPESCDYIIMNPPFAKATNHGGGRTEPVPPFAVFGIPPKEQIKMGKHNAKIYAKTCSHGHAGLASYFLAICHQKLKPGGSMGLILPNTFMSGVSWNNVRDTLSKWYDDIVLIHVGIGTYSSSTNMYETILVARKISGKAKQRSENTRVRIKSVLLDSMPESALAAWETARVIKSTEPVRLEDSTGHTSIVIGGDVVGKSLSCPVEGDLWWAGRARDTALLQFVYDLAYGLPTESISRHVQIPITSMGSFIQIGKHHLDIIGTKPDGTPQGPFNKIPPTANPTYPCLWNNNAEKQTTMIVGHDCSLERKSDASVDQVKMVWSTATNVHINYQIGYASQRLVVAYTKIPVLGGTSWPNVKMDKLFEKAFTVWNNSTFGVLLYWIVAGSQQPGRGRMSLTAFQTVLRTLDVRKLTKIQLSKFNELFDRVCCEELLPINRLDEDSVRKSLDDGVMKILGIEVDMDRIRTQLVAEPQFTVSATDRT